MRVAAILGILVFSGLAILFYKLGINTYKDEKAAERPWSPSWIGFGVALCFGIIAVLCCIYALGLWDAFVEWGQFVKPEPAVSRQF